MANNQTPEPLDPIDNDLFHSYTRYQLCQLKRSTSLWTSNKEREAMLNILGQFESIDGNILRMVVNQIFENSAIPHNMNDTHEAPLSYQGASTSTRYLESVPSSPSTASTEASNSETADRTWTSRSNTSSRKRTHRLPLTKEELPVAKKSKTYDPVIEKLKKLISRPNMEELLVMVEHVERSKYIILTRMRRVSTSFKLKVSTATSHYSLHITTAFGDHREPLSMCQSNLIAYRFGKMVEQGVFQYKNKKKTKAEAECYQAIREEMHARGQRIATPVHKYARYAQNVVKTADKIGAYALFMPEILSPYGIQVISRDNFPILKSCLDVKCAGFKEIARFDRDSNLIMAELDNYRKHGDKRYRQTNSKFLNASA